MIKSSGDYDYTHSYLQGYTIDWERMSAAHKRQSVKGADFLHLESRLNQESVFDVAVEMRPDHNPNKVIDVDEGAGVSGQKKIYQRDEMLNAWKYLLDDKIGTWFSVREDRLFRDRHGTQSSAFTEECQRHHCILIIVGKRCYDFSRDDDLKVFKTRMDEAAAYLRHVRYMNDMALKKQGRGEWIGGGIVAPYAIDRVQLAKMKEFIKQQRLLGLRALDIDFTEEMSQASRPVIYQPWLDRAIDLFEKMRLFNYEVARLMRYIEEKPYIFPLPTADDRMRYLFRTSMKEVRGGYTFSQPQSAKRWMLNLQHIGWMIAGRDEESGEYIYLEDCLRGAIPRDLFEENYIQLKGEDLDGNRIERVQHHARFTRAAHTGHTDALLSSASFKSEYEITTLSDGQGEGHYICRTKPYQVGTPSEHTCYRVNLWGIPFRPFDRAIVDRLAELAEHDKELGERLRKYFAQQKESKIVDRKLITNDILALQQQYDHLHMLLTTPGMGFNVKQLQDIAKDQQEIQHKIDEAQCELDKINEKQPSTVIPRFYDVLGDVPGEFWKQELDHRRRMLRMLIESIQIENISTHVFVVCVNWIAPVSPRPDAALLYRKAGRHYKWTPEEEEELRGCYTSSEKDEILRRFPDCSWVMVHKKALSMGMSRNHLRGTYSPTPLYESVAYNDWLKTCDYYKVEAESEEGQAILQMLNAYAEQEETKQPEQENEVPLAEEVPMTMPEKPARRRIEMLWLLPAEKMSIKALIDKTEDDIVTNILKATKSKLEVVRTF